MKMVLVRFFILCLVVITQTKIGLAAESVNKAYKIGFTIPAYICIDGDNCTNVNKSNNNRKLMVQFDTVIRDKLIIKYETIVLP